MDREEVKESITENAKLFIVDLKEFDGLKSVELRAWANEHGGIRIISVAQNTKPSMYVLATPKGIEDMQRQFNWVEGIRGSNRDDCLQISEQSQQKIN